MVQVFSPGTSDQVDLKLEIRAKLARIIWPGRRQKREPSWLTFHGGPLLKMCAKLALLFYESTLLKIWDKLSHISKKKANNKKQVQVVLNYLTYADPLPANLAGS